MNTLRLASLPTTLAVAALATATLLALPARAQEATPDYPQARASAVERSAVQAETLRARAAGAIVDGESTHVAEAQNGASVAVRAEVRAEAIAARRLGLTAQGELFAPASDAQRAALSRAARDAVALQIAATR